MKRSATILLAGIVAGVAACEPGEPEAEAPLGEEPVVEEPMTDEPMEQMDEAQDLLEAALGTIQEMRSDPEAWNLLQAAEGVFLVPRYGRVAAGAGVSGGEGVLLTRTDQDWSAPVFYDVGGISVGAQLGASGGEIAMILVTPEAVESFHQENNFSLTADAGFVLLDYSAIAEATSDEGDIIMWSDTEGAFAGVSLGISDINFDEEENAGYYQQPVTPMQIMEGQITSPHPELLRQELTGSM